VDEINWDDLDKELEKCHPALMNVWNRYRDQMHRRGFETVDVLQDLALKVYKKRDQFRGARPRSFCEWSRVILRGLIVEELRRRRHGHQHLDSDMDAVNPAQQRPSEEFQDDVRYAAYNLARANLPEHELALIDLMSEFKPEKSKPGLSMREVGERLRKGYPQLWQIHYSEWYPEEPKLRKACERARKALDKSFTECHRLLEGGCASKNSHEQ
jgi:RNA polymerase sigma factor (sigma-70 family)